MQIVSQIEKFYLFHKALTANSALRILLLDSNADSNCGIIYGIVSNWNLEISTDSNSILRNSPRPALISATNNFVLAKMCIYNNYQAKYGSEIAPDFDSNS